MSLKDERKNIGLTQQQLADKAGVNIRWIQKIESGEINLENITVANAFRLISALYSDTEDPDLYGCFASARTCYFMIRELLKPV